MGQLRGTSIKIYVSPTVSYEFMGAPRVPPADHQPRKATKMNDEIKDNEIPVWLRIPVGIFLIFVILLCIFGAITLFVDSPKTNPTLSFIAGTISILLSIWGLDKSVRMIFGLRREFGLVSITTLKVASFVFLLFPIGGLFTGYYAEKGLLALIQAVCNVSIFFGLQNLAKTRQAKRLNKEDS